MAGRSAGPAGREKRTARRSSKLDRTIEPSHSPPSRAAVHIPLRAPGQRRRNGLPGTRVTTAERGGRRAPPHPSRPPTSDSDARGAGPGIEPARRCTGWDRARTAAYGRGGAGGRAEPPTALCAMRARVRIALRSLG